MTRAAANFAPDPHRRSLIAKVHVARKELGLDEDTYRGVLGEVTGHASAKDCDDAQLVAVLDHFKLRGFSAAPRKAGKTAATRRADHPSARKARALWISLYQLGVVRNASEQALEAFAARQLKCERMQWARQSDSFRLIEALKDMAERAGWWQRGARGEQLSIEQLQAGLCDAILTKLRAAGVVPKTLTLDVAAGALGVSGIADLSARASALGAILRRAGLANHAKD